MRTVFQWLTNGTTSAEGVVHDQRQVMLLCERNEGFEVRHGESGITDGFEIDRFGLGID